MGIVRLAVLHETLPADALRTRDVYRLMTDVIAPRPIAWVSTLSDEGRPNLAPFSYFQGICSNPPTVVLGISWHRNGRPKDTLRNILARREFTISHVSEPLVEAMNATSGEYPAEVDEWELSGEPGARLPAAAALEVAPPRVAEARAALECTLMHAIPIGQGPTGMPSSTLVVGRIVCFSLAKGLLRRNEAGHLLPIDPAQLAAVGRLGGIAYTRTRETFRLPRPTIV
jgi:flavin reductase (DIM6/NTAB) family NADH-FMN oxidoreductase RutF